MYEYNSRNKQIVNKDKNIIQQNISPNDKLRTSLLDLCEAIEDICTEKESFNKLVKLSGFGVSPERIIEMEDGEPSLIFEFPTLNFKNRMLTVCMQRDDTSLIEDKNHG